MVPSDFQDKYQSAQLQLANLNQQIGATEVELENLKSKLSKILHRNKSLSKQNQTFKEEILELETKLQIAEQELLSAQLMLEAKEKMLHLIGESRSFKIGKALARFVNFIPGRTIIKSSK
jgi:chromosome segregation ATPase